MKFSKKLISTASHLLSSALISGFAGGVSYLLYIWTGYPRGNDAVGHVFKVKVIAEFWPHFNWVHSWGGGMPHFLRYPLLPYPPLAFIHQQTGIEIGLLLTGAGVLAVALSAVGIYLLVWELTKSRIVSLVSAFVYALTPASWSYAFAGGTYARAFATPFLVLAPWSFIRALKKGETLDKQACVLTAVFLALSFLSHFIVGVLSFLLVFLLGLLVVRGLKEKLIVLSKIFIPAILLTASSSFSLPFLATKPSAQWLGDISECTRGVPWTDLLYLLDKEVGINEFYLNKLSPFLLPLVILLFLAVFSFRRKELLKNTLLFQVILIFSSLSLLLLIFVKGIFGPFDLLCVIVGIPVSMLHYLAILVAPLVGILLFLSIPTGKLRLLPPLLVILVVGFWVKVQLVDVMGSLGADRFCPTEAYSAQRFQMVEEMMVGLDHQFNFRLGTEDAGTGGWFNTRFPYVPQTRDYFAQGVVDQEQRFYLIYSLFHQKDNYQETNFLMDWWGVKQFMALKGGDIAGKYISKPEFYRCLDIDRVGFDGCEFRQPTPILAATDSPSILFIGKKASYNVFFRSLAYSNLNSRHLIPIHGDEFIDSYSSDELQKFRVLVLYDYRFRDSRRAAELLKSFVENGGGVVMESNMFADEERFFGEILPVYGVEHANFGKKWRLSLTADGEEALGDIALSKFGEAVFLEGPWGVAVAKGTRDWARVFLREADRPILAGGDFGKGRVVWSGMNLPYHIDSYTNEEESKLWGRLLNWAGRIEGLEIFEYPEDNNSLIYETATFSAEFVNPEKRVVTVKKPVSGVLLKEFYFPNWHAHIMRNGKKEGAKIYRAGPEFMYVPIPQGTSYPVQVIFEYRKSSLEQAAAAISFVTLAALVLYLWKGWMLPPTWRRAGARALRRSTTFLAPVREWWEKEEV